MKLTEYEALKLYDDFLDEIYGENFGRIKICGYEYQASRAFKEIDPVAYREDFFNFINSEEIDIEE